MTTKRTPLSRIARAGVVVASMLLLPVATSARPSLVDLDADVQQIVDALCHGDPALCGLAAPAQVGGQLDFDGGTFVTDFTALTFGFSKPVAGMLSFDALEATVDATGLTALLLADLAGSKVYSKVEVIVPNPTPGPATVVLLELTDAVLEQVETDATGASARLRMTFLAAELSWMGLQSGWDGFLSSGSGCTAPGGEQHVALAGSSASLLAVGEVEAEYGLTVPSLGTVGFQLTRAPVATSACTLRTTGSGTTLADSFHRLSPLSDTFGSQLRDESVDFSTALITDYSLHLEHGEMRETVTYDAVAGQLTTRTFDPGTGAQTGQTQQAF